jgi:hypothetical protein
VSVSVSVSVSSVWRVQAESHGAMRDDVGVNVCTKVRAMGHLAEVSVARCELFAQFV